MKSVFSKTMVGPNMFKPIKALSYAERGKLHYELSAKAKRTVPQRFADHPEQVKYKRDTAAAKGKYDGMKSYLDENPPPKTSKGHAKVNFNDPGLGGAAMVVGPKRGSQKVLFNNPSARDLIRRPTEHEMEHIRPRRSGYRLAEVMASPKKLGREEARADWFSGSSRSGRRYRFGESAYASLGRGKRKGQVLGNQFDEMLGNTDKFAGAYNEAQDTFKRRGVKFGARARENAAYADKHFGIKRTRSGLSKSIFSRG